MTFREALKKGDKSFSFYSNEDNKNIFWEVVFKDDEIMALYKDGSRIPKDKIEDYEDIVYENLPGFHPGHFNKRFHFDLPRFQENFDFLKKDWDDETFNFHFDSEEFKEEMNRLAEEIEKLDGHKIEIEFDSEKFAEKMKKLNEDLASKKFEFDADKLKKAFEEIDLNLKNELSGLNNNLRNLDFNLAGIDKALHRMSGFTDELKNEMVKDGIIKSYNDNFKLTLSEKELVVNDKKLEKKIHDKYKKIYEKHFDEELKGDVEFHLY
jgi:hypothetical protein